MSSDSCERASGWYVLNYIRSTFQCPAQKTVDSVNSRYGINLELFAPTYVVRDEKQGETKFRTANLTFHYVFVRGIFDEVKLLCAQPNGFSFLIDRGSEKRYAVIENDRMVHFMNIAKAYKNCLPYFSLDDIDLEYGDLVEVVKGDFPGLIGTFIPKAKGKTGNIMLNVYNKVGTIVFDVKASDVRVLEFAGNSTRANDQIDAFVPQLLKALRYFDRNKALPTALIAKLSVFCGRMAVVRLNNHKLEARLQMLLYAANLIIGNNDSAEKARIRYEQVKDSVTNEWTRGTNNLILSVLTNDHRNIVHGYEKLKALGASSKAQHMVMEEYEYHLSKGLSDT